MRINKKQKIVILVCFMLLMVVYTYYASVMKPLQSTYRGHQNWADDYLHTVLSLEEKGKIPSPWLKEQYDMHKTTSDKAYKELKIRWPIFKIVLILIIFSTGISLYALKK